VVHVSDKKRPYILCEQLSSQCGSLAAVLYSVSLLSRVSDQVCRFYCMSFYDYETALTERAYVKTKQILQHR